MGAIRPGVYITENGSLCRLVGKSATGGWVGEFFNLCMKSWYPKHWTVEGKSSIRGDDSYNLHNRIGSLDKEWGMDE